MGGIPQADIGNILTPLRDSPRERLARPYWGFETTAAPYVTGIANEPIRFIGSAGGQLRPDRQTTFGASVRRGLALNGDTTVALKSMAQHLGEDFGVHARVFDTQPEGVYRWDTQSYHSTPSETDPSEWHNFIDPVVKRLLAERNIDMDPDGMTFSAWKMKVNRTASRVAAEQMAAYDGDWVAGTMATALNVITDPLNLVSFGTLTGLKHGARMGRLGISKWRTARLAAVGGGIRTQPKTARAMQYLRALDHDPLKGVGRVMGFKGETIWPGLLATGLTEATMYASVANVLEEETFDKHHSSLDFLLAPALSLAGMGIINGAIARGVPAAGASLMKAIHLDHDAAYGVRASMATRGHVKNVLGSEDLAEFEAANGVVTFEVISDMIHGTLGPDVPVREGIIARLRAFTSPLVSQDAKSMNLRYKALREFAMKRPTADEWAGFFDGKMVTKRGKLKKTQYEGLVERIDRDNDLLIEATTDPARHSAEEIDKARKRLRSNMKKFRKLIDISFEQDAPRVKIGEVTSPKLALLKPKDRRLHLVESQRQKVVGTLDLLDALYFQGDKASMVQVVNSLIDSGAWKADTVVAPWVRLLQSGVFGEIGAFGSGVNALRKLNAQKYVDDPKWDIFKKVAGFIDTMTRTMGVWDPSDPMARRSLYRSVQADQRVGDEASLKWHHAVKRSVESGESPAVIQERMYLALAGQDVPLPAHELSAVKKARAWLNRVHSRGQRARVLGERVENYVPINLVSDAARPENVEFIGRALHRWWMKHLYHPDADGGGETHYATLSKLGWARLEDGRITSFQDPDKFVADLQTILVSNSADGGPKGIRATDIKKEHRAEYLAALADEEGPLAQEAIVSMSRRVGGTAVEKPRTPDMRFDQADLDARMIDDRVSRARKRKVEQEFYLSDDVRPFVDMNHQSNFFSYQQSYGTPITTALEVQAVTGLSGLRFDDLLDVVEQRAKQMHGDEKIIAEAAVLRMREVYNQSILNKMDPEGTINKQIQAIAQPLQNVTRASTSTVGIPIMLVEGPVAVAKAMLGGGLRNPIKQMLRTLLDSFNSGTRLEHFAFNGEMWESVSMHSRMVGQIGDDTRSMMFAGTLPDRMRASLQMIGAGFTKNGDIGPTGRFYQGGGLGRRALKVLNATTQVGAAWTKTLSLEEPFTHFARTYIRQETFGRILFDIQDGVLDRLAKLGPVPEHIVAISDIGQRNREYNKWVQAAARKSGALSRGRLKAGVFRVEDYAQYGLLEADSLAGGKVVNNIAGDLLRRGQINDVWAAIARHRLVNAEEAVQATRFMDNLVTYATTVADATSFRSRPWDRLGGSSADFTRFLFSLLSYSSGFYNRVLPRLGDEGAAFAAAILPVYIVGEFMQEFVRDMTVRGGETRDRWNRWVVEDDENWLDSQFLRVAARVNFLGPMGNIMANAAISTFDTGTSRWSLADASPAVAVSDNLLSKIQSVFSAAMDPDDDLRFDEASVKLMAAFPGLDNLLTRLFTTFGSRMTDEDSTAGRLFRAPRR